ncbi:hypothetical protein A1Q1_06107 [Trichosporon asahii var. asahii CBS 2479]|uniref:CFEM domain-containing protein n=1 Tax=Trichosporon asahii var. asahii (strain ATCC 90039 / CBS 2479 / JCM 2466 / KCTC 7840 / NBRC 103889/ NCYC 2677 / UAMH 7654) TaxID=1186058 RepID=J6EM05_TRIAS|nr:hypothetical protein A1Q1_06107 [Trichosporon asahii var. asahii CBS 2479]EJT45344.1 hypothetical protein A1Q1_06107 [Trichosporon asahii var. asahii CBS 2479]
MHLPTQVLEERAPSTTETALPLDHPIHKKKPPVVDPLATKRDEADLPLDPDIHRKKRSIIDPLPIKRDDLTPTVLPLSHPIHKKEPPIVDPLPIKRAKETPTSELPLDHPIHSKRPPIVDPLLFKRDAPSATVLPLDHPIHKKKPPIVNPVPVDLYPKRENDREAPWKRDDRGGEVAATQDSPASPAAQGGQANAAAAGPQTMIDGLPPCVRKCLFRAPVGKCDPTDFACLCRNDEYLKAVMDCWTINCDGLEVQEAISSAQTLCSTTLVAGPWPAESNVLTAPVIYSRAAWNIQAVMSSICALILLLAIVLGGLSCRAQARKEASHRSGTIGTKGSRDYISQGSGTGKGSASNRASAGQQVTTFGFGEESIVTSLPRIPAGPRKVPRFTAVPSEEKDADEKDAAAADAESWDLAHSKHSHSRTHSRAHSRAGSKSSRIGSRDGHEVRSLLPNPLDDGHASDTSDIGMRVLPYALSSPSSSSGGSHNETTIVIGPDATSGRRPDVSPLESIGSVRTHGAESSTEDEPFARHGA